MSRSAPHAYRAALGHRELRWLTVSFGVHSVVGWTAGVVVVVDAVERTDAAFWAGVLTAVRFLAALLFSPSAGAFAERQAPRTLMLRVNLAAAAIVGLLALAVRLEASVVLLVVLSAALAIVITPYYPATAAVLPELAEERELAAANALVSLVENLALFVGPLVAALLLALGDPAGALVANAALYGVAAVAVARMRPRRRGAIPAPADGERLRHQIAAGWQAVFASRGARVLMGFVVATSVLYGFDTVVFVELSRDRLGTGTEGYGLLMAALGVGAILAAPIIEPIARGGRLAAAMSVAMVVYTAPTAVLVFVDQTAIVLVVQVIRGAGTLVVDVLAVTALQRAVPAHTLARVFGLYVAVYTAAIAAGGLVGAASVGVLGLDMTFVLMAIVPTALVVVAAPVTAAVDRAGDDRLAVIRPRLELLQPLGLLSSASRLSLERLAASATELRVPAGTRIITEGDEADAFYVVAEGRLRVLARGELGEERPIRAMGPGDAFGEIGLLQHIRRTASVDAVTDVELLRVEGPDLLDAIGNVGASAGFLDLARARLALTHPSHEWSDPDGPETSR